MAEKKLLYAKDIPLIGIDGTRKSRRKELFDNGHPKKRNGGGCGH